MRTEVTLGVADAKLIDIHAHIIPGADDGAKSMEESVRMLKMAAGEGIGTIILTPHQKADRKCISPDEIQRMTGLLQKEADSLKIPVKFYPGNEIFYRHGLEDALEEKQVRTMADSRYVLVEFFPNEDYAYIRNALSRLTSYGYRPIVAHVERYEKVTESMDRMHRLKKDTGCLYQINAESLLGGAGFAHKNICRRLVKEELADFAATDAHGAQHRPPKLKKCAEWLEKRMGAEYMKKLLITNPQAILENAELPGRRYL